MKKNKGKKTRFVAMMMAAALSMSAMSGGFTVQAMEETGEDVAESTVENEPVSEAQESEETAAPVSEENQMIIDEQKSDSEQKNDDAVDQESDDEMNHARETEAEIASETVTEEEGGSLIEESEEKTPSFVEAVEGVDTSGIDFSSCELMIGTEDPSILTWDTEVLSEYRGVYLTHYESPEITKNAYTYYQDKAEFVSANITFRVADNENSQENADLSNLNEGDDAFSNLNDLSISGSVPAGTIALIDTGVSASDLIGSATVLGGSASDDNSHGTKMYEYIKDEYPEAKVLSIKALDASGKGQASSVCAAIQYAVEAGADIINLSISAYSTADNAAVRTAIENAVANGITVCGAAGNNGSNAKYYLPGSINSAMILGACDANCVRMSGSNYGDTVDGYLEAESTSEAAARFSALVARDGFEMARSYLKAGTGDPIQEDGDINWMEPGWFEAAAYPSHEVSPKTLKDSANKEYTVPDLMYIDYKITGTGSLIGSYWTNPLDGKSYKRGTYLTAEWGEPYAPTYLYHSTTENKDYTLDTKLKKNEDGTYYAKKADGTYDTTTTITYRKNESKAFCVDYGKSTPYSGTGTARLYLDSTSVDSEGRVRYVAFGTTSKGSGYQRVGMYVYLKVTNVPEYHYTSIWKWESTGDDEYPVTGATRSMEGINYTLYSKDKKKIAVFHMDKDGYAYDITDIASGYTELDTKYASHDQHYLKAPENETMEGFYYVEGGKNDWYTIDTTPIPASVVSNTSDPTKITSGDHDRFKDGITEGFDTKKKYYAAFIKQGKVSQLSLEGIVYGLYDAKDVGEDHLVARFLMDADGFVRAIQITNACKASTKYIEWDEDNEKFKMWNYALKENGTVKTRSIRLSLLDDEPQGFYFHEIQANKYYEKSDEWIPAVWVAMDDKPTTLADFGSNYAQFTKAKDNPEIGVTLKKETKKTDCDITGNPNYSLEGAEYKLFQTRADADAARISRNKGNADYSKAIGTFTVKADGSSNEIKVTDYMPKDANGSMKKETKKFYVVESKAPEHFEIDPTEIGEADVSIENVDENPATFIVYDKPVADPINVFVKKAFADGTEQFLAGATFTVKYYAEDISKNYSYAQLQSKTPKITNTYTTELDADTGIIMTRIQDEYPMGYLTIEESEAPIGFTLDGSSATINGKAVSNVKMCFVLLSGKSEETGNVGYEADAAYLINDQGQRSDTDAFRIAVTNEVIVSDQAVRGDIEVRKMYDTTDDPWEGAFFRIENVDTKEAHYIVTDADGYASTSAVYQLHSENTGYYDDGKAYDKTKAGVWFAKGIQNTEAVEPNDKVGAMPKGHYTVTETDANGLQKEEPVEVWIGYTMSRDANGKIIWTDTDSDGVVYQIYDYNRGDGRTEIADIELPKLGTLAVVSVPEALDIDRTKEMEINDAILAQVSKVLPADKNQTIYDICTYAHLKVDTTFTLVGTLMQKKEDGTLVEFATAKTTFTTKSGYEKSRYEACGTEIVKFEGLDFTDIEDTEFVVYERLFLGTETEGDEILTTYPDSNNTVVKFPLIHEAPEDKYQTVKTPTGPTTADNGYGSKTLVVSDTIKIRDRVDYKGLEIGKKYLLVGTLYKRPKDDPDDKVYTEAELETLKVRDENGNPITAEKLFMATQANGTEYVTFEFSARLFQSEAETFVVFEDCYSEDRSVRYFHHADIHDQGQTVYKPQIGTKAESIDKRSEVLSTDDKFYDTVSFENLEANTRYLLRGVAIDKATGKPLILNGKEVRVDDHYFTTGSDRKKNGAVDGATAVTFEITEDMQKDLEGKHMVIFEYLYSEDGKVQITKHEEPEDDGQQLYVPHIQTTLLDKATETHVAAYSNEIMTLVDTVTYTGLIPNKRYVMEGTLHIQDENETAFVDEEGNPIKASKEFVASETGNGTVELEFSFNAAPLYVEGKSVVAFEECMPEFDKKPVAVHADIHDRNQTVDFPKVGTKAGLVKKSVTEKTATFEVTDQILLTNLNTDYSYTAKGWLVDKKGKKVVIDGVALEAEKTFTMENPNGSINITFPQFTVGKFDSFTYVVYEEVYVNVPQEDGSIKQFLVGAHKDITDSKQTVSYKDQPQTGDETPIAIFLGLLVLAMAGIGMVIWKKRRINHEAK